ncbi:hypothetical protein [Nocardioides sp.]|uniref:hypothetical protein n=1 Tax=Nocardioides sp. TaxID=35761 RepID=UPI003569D0FA
MASGRWAVRAPWIGLGAAGVLMLLAFGLPHLLDWQVFARAPRSSHAGGAPPLHGYWQPTLFGPGTIPALALALLGWRYAAEWAQRLSWRRLLALSYIGSLGWLLSLALVDGSRGISRALGNPYEYLRSARAVDDVAGLLGTYVSRIPIDSVDAWPTHVAGHPPGALLFFVGLDRVGLGGDFAAGMVVTLMAASSAAAVLVTLRALGAESVARVAAPFLVLTPAAVFMAVSADGLIAAVVAWGIAALALGASAPSRGRLIGWSGLAGVLLGSSVMMSYGMPLVGVLAVAVLVLAGNWRPLPIAVLTASAVVLLFAANGFSWWEAYPVLRERYYDGIAAQRPLDYWIWANLALLLVSAGPLIAAGLAAAGTTVSTTARHEQRVALGLVAAGVAMVVLADLSGMSKAEVERIWLPFIPWLTISCALLPQRWRAPGLALQAGTALVVQHLLYTVW